MNSSSALNQRSGEKTKLKGASNEKDGQSLFEDSFTGGGAAKVPHQAKRSWADVAAGKAQEKPPKGRSPKAIFTQQAASSKAAASSAIAVDRAPKRSYADAVSGANRPSSEGLLAEDEQALAAFAAMRNSQARVDLDESRIAPLDDLTLPLDDRKVGNAVDGSGDAGNQHLDEEGNQPDANEGDDGNHIVQEDGRASSNDRQEEEKRSEGRGGADKEPVSGNEGDADPGENGQEGREDQKSFHWNRKQRKAEERRQRQLALDRIAAKAAKKTQDLMQRLAEEEAANREASALRKRNRSSSAPAKSRRKSKEPAQASGAVQQQLPVNSPPTIPLFQRPPRQQRKARAKTVAKAGKASKRQQPPREEQCDQWYPVEPGQPALKIGDQVLLQNLNERTDLNGWIAVVITEAATPEGRVEVSVGCGKSRERAWIRPTHMLREQQQAQEEEQHSDEVLPQASRSGDLDGNVVRGDDEFNQEGRSRQLDGSQTDGRRVRSRDDTEGPAATSSRRERRALEKSERSATKGNKNVEFERHRRATNRREEGRESARDLVRAALQQLKRQSQGQVLDSNEQQLATFAANLSPAKILGMGIRMGAASSGEGSESEAGLDLLQPTADQADDSVDELIEELGCSASEARDALNRSCGWTASGKSSRVKAANWLRRQLEEVDRRRQASRAPPERADVAEHKLPPHPPTREARGSNRTSGAVEPPRTKAKITGYFEADRKPVRNNQVHVSGRERGETSEFPPSSSEFSSESSRNSVNGSDSDSSSSGAGAKKNKRSFVSFLSLDRSRQAPQDRHASRYLRNLGKLLLIDEAESREVYAETQASPFERDGVSMAALIRTFYLREVRGAKGTQADHARSLEAGAAAPPGPSPNPTFTLPDWAIGQPPIGGVHFSTLTAMLEAYEKFERQTNYQTSVTFKSMVKADLRPSFESKCGLPRTVWKNPKATDADRVLRGLPEEGGWSDIRFLSACRRTLAPIGRTTYEIAFEKLRIYHRGNDSQLSVTLSIWGEKWLAKEREAEEQKKTLPVPKMKILFKTAVSSVPKFKRWLEGRMFLSSSDWFNLLSRKLHKTLGKTQEEEHDNRDTRQYPSQDGGRPAWRGRGYEPRGGGDVRGGTGRGGGEPARGPSQPYRNTSTGNTGGFGRDSAADAQGLSSYQFSAPPGRTNHISGEYGCEHDPRDGFDAEVDNRGDWMEPEDTNWDRNEEHGNGHHEHHGEGRFNAAGAHGHSGGAEPMTYSPSQSRGRGGSRGGRGGGEARSPRKPVNDPAEDTVERLQKGVRWHDSKKANGQCRDQDCGTRQDVPFCQGCGMHGHDRPFCFKGRESQYNAKGYWDQNRPNQLPIQGLRGLRSGTGEGAPAATARGNMMDSTAGSY